MQPLELIDKYYHQHAQARDILLAHSRQVADLATDVAERVSLATEIDIEFIEQAALLHDIGMLYVNAPALGCSGEKPYIVHGVLGAELLKREQLPRHALVCERHIGVGLTIEDIKQQQLPLPLRDMCPQSLEEEIIAYADLFFSKTKPGMRSSEMVRESLSHFGHHKVIIFDRWHKRFGG